MIRKALFCALVLPILLATAPAATAQARDNSWEIGAFSGVDFYGNELKLENTQSYGLRFGFNITPSLELEVSYASSAAGNLQQPTSTLLPQHPPLGFVFDPSTEAKLTSANFRIVGNFVNGWRHWKPLVFIGAGRHEFEFQKQNPPVPQGNSGGTTASIGAGTRFFFNDHLALRAEGSIEYATKDIYWNQLLTVGIVAILGGAKPSDKDGDAVTDIHDRCVETPKGAVVDGRGCPLDGDKDLVFDGLDQCPDTPEKWPVDEKGCPTDTDSDGVPDGAEKCPDTPKGAKVDAQGCPLDADGDTVFDGLDECDGTPFGARVDAKGCPLDEDKDGVADGIDTCPQTPIGAKPDEKGCPTDSDQDRVFDGLDECAETPGWWSLDEKGCPTPRLDRLSLLILEKVTFKSGSATLEPEAFRSLDQAVEALSYWSDLKVEIGGFTDNAGTADQNRALSLDRAKSVKTYLTGKGIDAARLEVKGFGAENPVADNNTPEGQSQNRRVELKKIGGDESIHPPLSSHVRPAPAPAPVESQPPAPSPSPEAAPAGTEPPANAPPGP